MKPAYRIMTVIRAAFTHAIFREAIIGLVVGVIIYANWTDRKGNTR